MSEVFQYIGDRPLVIVIKWHPDPLGGPAIQETTIMLTKGDKIDLSIIGLKRVKSRTPKGDAK